MSQRTLMEDHKPRVELGGYPFRGDSLFYVLSYCRSDPRFVWVHYEGRTERIDERLLPIRGLTRVASLKSLERKETVNVNLLHECLRDYKLIALQKMKTGEIKMTVPCELVVALAEQAESWSERKDIDQGN